MTGTIINMAAVLLGGTLGLLIGSRLKENTRLTVVAGMGLFTAVIGIKMFFETQNPLIVLGGLLIGSLLGEWWKIEESLQSLGKWLENLFLKLEFKTGMQGSPSRGTFVKGFLTASLLFCVGPMTILGSLQDGLTGDYSLLAIKSVLDGFAALAFTSTLGVGVLFSILVILFYQGGISLLSAQISPLISQAMMAEISATGGVILVGIAVSSLLEIKKMRVGNFLPALLVAPFIAWFISILK
jgi:uncharacterized membrane protein YqgA involved in biofilm formation